MPAVADPDGMLGAHISIAGGIPRAVDRALQVGARAMQIFVKNNNRWQGRPLEPQEADRFRDRVAEERISATLAHASYLINLASPDDVLWEKSKEALIGELSRCQKLGLSHLVVHPGAHTGSGVGAGIQRICDALNRIHRKTPDCRVKLALETTAGQGTSIGHRFEELGQILQGIEEPCRVAVCMDTCHVFAAGYEIRTWRAFRKMLREFDARVGLKKLQVLHFNDSKCPLGSRVDRHANIGEGEIGVSGFRWFLREQRLHGVPKILETPKGKDHLGDKRNLAILRSLAEETPS